MSQRNKNQSKTVQCRSIVAPGDTDHPCIIISGQVYSKILKGNPSLIKRRPDLGDMILTTSKTTLRMAQEQVQEESISLTLPARMYHVTYDTHVARILREGLHPRRETGNDNFQTNSCSSHEEFVYLTEGNVLRYLYILHQKRKGDDLCVIAIETQGLEESLLYPDEDWVGVVDCLKDKDAIDDKAAVIKFHQAALEDITRYQHLWKASLAGLGNIAYRGTIPPEAIKRVVRVRNLSASENVLELQKGDYLPAAYPILRKGLLEYQDAWFEQHSLKALTATRP